MWGQDLPDGESPPPHGRFGRLRRRLPAHDLLRLVFDVHLPNEPFRCLPDESVTVADVLGVTVDDLLPAAGQEFAP